MSCYEAPSEYAASEVLVVSLRRVFACTMYLVVYSGICAIVETFFDKRHHLKFAVNVESIDV